MADYDIVTAAHREGRLTASDYIAKLAPDFMELHGDRLCGDDAAVIGGIGTIGKIPVTLIALEKGKTTEERIRHNFGSAHPEGYRKALRLMQQAEKFRRPVVCLVDTAGAFCGVDAEEHGQGRAIADNLAKMSTLRTPILSVILGEGGSGGALALCHSDRIWMMEDAYLSVVSPESCANILWKDTARANEAAEALALTAPKLRRLQLIDRICKAGDPKALAADITAELTELRKMTFTELLETRYRKFRTAGY
ncbi:MAG: acetyl-CoA carboxylase carboxyl transferase subunit alpha [Lachnospiraceae bacterium]|nr:acetyl-CoA carboxylase carboxyl transferase subunit alpha [Lachnospiraceae bacterium]